MSDVLTTTTETTATAETAATSIPDNPAGDVFVGPTSQEELEKLLNDARAEAVAGFADYETLKEQVASAEKLTGELSTVQEEFNTFRIESALREEAIKANAINVDQVLALLDRGETTVGEDGKVTGAAEAVSAFLESNPHFASKRTKPLPSLAEKTAAPSPTLLTDAELRHYQKNPAALAADPALLKRFQDTVEHKRETGTN